MRIEKLCNHFDAQIKDGRKAPRRQYDRVGFYVIRESEYKSGKPSEGGVRVILYLARSLIVEMRIGR